LFSYPAGVNQILLVEDDPQIGAFLTKGFEDHGYAVDAADNGEDALVMAMTSTYDAAIVDLMLPGMDGLTLIKRLRSEKIRFPIVVLSAKRGVNERVECLERGADDYVGKPFAFSELQARVQAVMRRSAGQAEPTRLEVADLVLDRLTRKVFRQDGSIDLHSREFALLELLMLHAGKVMTKTFLLEKLWDYNFDPQTNVVDVLVCRLRNKVDRDFSSKLIHTLRGVGYVLRASSAVPVN
jgi:DNA-binding response OmpR family regulator